MSKYKVGDNVVIRKDLEDGKHYRGFLWNENSMKLLKEMTSVKIDAIHKCQNGTAYAVYFNNFFIPDEMIAGLHEEPVEDETKYLWASDEFEQYGYKYIKFMIKGNNARSYDIDSILHKEILKGKHDKFLMTESEAKEHHLFKAMNRIEVEKEEWYYIRIKGDKTQWLNLNLKDDKYFMSDKDEYEMYKTKFTKEECDEIIGTSRILHKVLVE